MRAASISRTSHPPGLYVCFFTELWERYSFYSMMAILSLYMNEALHFDVATVGSIYGTYQLGVYFLPVFGGLAADRLYVGATGCAAAENTATGRTRGCLTIVNLTSRTAMFPELSSLRGAFDVTAITPITGRNVVYICEGGELDIFDTATDTITNDKLDVVGVAVDAIQIDP